ncbi:helix-turn-helix transcriptional regulator [Planococcus shixiaomingii]|uniref:helix-turn-helix transcriptional regulator n=1 Tax=Planococcus shixiaomingii TaxID=3058393 RepID=UPI002608818A|nr:helix-turn-helix transcriptional regulator [Planococcus sp. N022]WKA55350.1 helix-turn-helix transcriptional regulator [Planococcus sp. N022]
MSNSIFGEKIKSMRLLKGLTIREVAQNAGISHSYLSQIENHRRDTPSPDIVKKIAEGLNADYYDLLRIAGYANTSHSHHGFISKQIKMAPDEFKKEFMGKHDQHLQREIRWRDEMTEKFGYPLDSPEVAVRFPDTFLFNATASDYLKLLRVNKEITIEEMADRLGIDAPSYREAEEENELNYFSEFLLTHSEKLGEIFEVGDFRDWLLTVYTETPNQSFIDAYKPEAFTKEITLLVPSVVKKINKEGNVYFQKYDDEQLKSNFNKLENILSPDHSLSYAGKILSPKDKSRIMQMIDILLDN